MAKPRAKSAAKKVKPSAHQTAKTAGHPASASRRKAAAAAVRDSKADPNALNGSSPESLRSLTGSGMDLAEKVKELVRLAQEQGYLTYNDINDALPDAVVSPEELDDLYSKLRTLEVEIVDQAEVDRVKQPEPEEEEDKTRLDILDDPVRMYLKQMGQVPLADARAGSGNFQAHRVGRG